MSVGVVPFNGSICKFIIMAFVCGGITFAILIFSLIWSVFETFREKR